MFNKVAVFVCKGNLLLAGQRIYVTVLLQRHIYKQHRLNDKK